MEKIFEAATSISTPLGLAGLFGIIFFYIIRTIILKNGTTKRSNSKEKNHNSNVIVIRIINYLFILCFISVLLGFSGYIIINKYRPNNKITLSGIVFVDGVEKEGVLVKALEVEKTVRTNYFGKYLIEFSSYEKPKFYTLRFSYPQLEMDSTITISTDSLNKNIYFISKSKNKIDAHKILMIQKSIKIEPEGIKEFEKILEHKSYKLSNDNPKYVIQFSFTDKIEKVKDELYRYNGGFVTASINNKMCCILSDLKLKATFNGGNSIGFVSSDLKNQIENLIQNNSNYVFQKIEECLN